MDSQGHIRRGALAIAAACLTLLLASGTAEADILTPTRLDDPAPGRCKPTDCSLREAIRASNNREGRDKIILGRGSYELQLPPNPAGAGFDSGSFDLIDGVNIRGRGAGKSTIDGNGIDKVIQGWVQGAPDAFKLADLTVTGGFAPAGHDGGGIDLGSRQDSLTLRHVTITGNSAPRDGGGLMSRGLLTIVDSTISDNTAQGGGGLAVIPAEPTFSATIRNSRIIGNRAALGGGLYGGSGTLQLKTTTIAANSANEGGGVDLISQDGLSPLTEIMASTVSGNSARKGGGVLVDGNQPRPGLNKPLVSIANSTVALNTTTAEGGGIMADNGAEVRLDNATVAYNRADSDGVGGGVGGGVHQHSGAVFSLRDSIVAANLGTGTTQQCDGTFAASDGLVLQTQTAFCPIDGEFKIVPDVLLGPLADNGGPTQTVGLVAESAAVGFARTCPSRDQRGIERPPEGCDSGAFERGEP